MKVNVERFGYNNLRQDFKFMESVVKIFIYLPIYFFSKVGLSVK